MLSEQGHKEYVHALEQKDRDAGHASGEYVRQIGQSLMDRTFAGTAGNTAEHSKETEGVQGSREEIQG